MSASLVKTVDSELRRYTITRHEYGGAVWFQAEYRTFKRGTDVPWQAPQSLVRLANAFVRGTSYPKEPMAEVSDTPFHATEWSDGGKFQWSNRASYRTGQDAERVVADEVARDNRKAPKFVRTMQGRRVYVDTKTCLSGGVRQTRWTIYVNGVLFGKGVAAHEAAAREHAWTVAASWDLGRVSHGPA